MGRSLALGNLAGVRLAADGLFVLMVAVALWSYPLQTLVVLGSLAAHELAHLIAAWAAGLDVDEVRLTPFGGVARLGDTLDIDPFAEMSVALAGPFNSLALAALMAMVSRTRWFDQRLVEFCFNCNASLAFFNLLPALPLDGGRALRGLLSRRWGYGRVGPLLIASGRACAVAMTAVALVALLRGRLYLAPLVGGPYLWWSAGHEEADALYRTFRLFLRKQERMRKQGVLPGRHLVAAASARLCELLPNLTGQPYHLVLVVGDDMMPLGTLSEAQLHAGFNRFGPQVTLGELVNGA